jgi:hypothetical protein
VANRLASPLQPSVRVDITSINTAFHAFEVRYLDLSLSVFCPGFYQVPVRVPDLPEKCQNYILASMLIWPAIPVISLWLGVGYAALLLGVSVGINRRLMSEQIGFTVSGALACQNIFPPLQFILFALTANHLPVPLAGQEKYLLVAGIASEMVTLVSLYSLFLQALKRFL